MISASSIAYIGDVPVEKSFHGSALLYRLLEDYPADRLQIVECGSHSRPDRRLKKVDYQVVAYPFDAWRNTRLWRLASSADCLLADLKILCEIRQRVSDFRPDAVVSVGHGFSWYAAYRLAQEFRVPFRFIVHDDVPNMVRLFGPIKKLYKRRFAEVYCGAQSRFCVSPYMVDAYRDRYGTVGQVLYPGRSKHVSNIQYREPSNPPDGQLRFAFAGTINTQGFVDSVNDLDRALNLAGINAQILMFGPFSEADARNSGLMSTRAQFGGLIPSDQVVERLRDSADVLFLPLSFAESDRGNMSLHFPSKLTDYTATGLPIIVYGPDYCSGVRWARGIKAAFAIATTQEELVDQVNLLTLPNIRVEMGKASFEVGAANFDHAVISAVFNNHIAAPRPSYNQLECF